jgi:putative ABC transport system permease protein
MDSRSVRRENYLQDPRGQRLKFLPLIVRNIARNRRRNLLTALSIAVSLFIFSALISLPRVAQQLKLSASASRIITVNKTGIAFLLPEAYKRRIRAMPHVRGVIEETYFGGIYQDPHDQFPNTSLDPDEIATVYPDLEIPRDAVERFQKIRTAALVGIATMQKYHWHVGQQIMLKGTIYPVDVTLQIVGTLRHKFTTAVIFRRDYLEDLLPDKGWGNDIIIKLDRPDSAPTVIGNIDETFANSSFPTRTASEASFMQDFMGMLKPLFQLAALLSVIVLIALALVSANTAAMSVRERHAEFAMMRALGFRPALIAAVTLAESAALGVAGGLVGCAATYLIVTLFPIGEAALGGIGVIRMPAWLIAEGAAIGALVGIAGATIPALRAARRNIVDALRAVV